METHPLQYLLDNNELLRNTIDKGKVSIGLVLVVQDILVQQSGPQHPDQAAPGSKAVGYANPNTILVLA